jgi:hypothetical protein
VTLKPSELANLRDGVGQLRKQLPAAQERVNESMITDDMKRLISGVHCLKDEMRKLKMTAKERTVLGSLEGVSPVELGPDLAPESEDRIDRPIILNLREEIGAAKASADVAKAAADAAQTTIYDAKWAPREDEKACAEPEQARRASENRSRN